MNTFNVYIISCCNLVCKTRHEHVWIAARPFQIIIQNLRLQSSLKIKLPFLNEMENIKYSRLNLLVTMGWFDKFCFFFCKLKFQVQSFFSAFLRIPKLRYRLCVFQKQIWVAKYLFSASIIQFLDLFPNEQH